MHARYRMHPDWDDRGPKGAIEVHEALALTPDAERELWGYLFSVDLTVQTRIRNLPVDSPLRFMLADQRSLGMTVTDALWVRLVDVPEALSRRTYGASDRVVFEVRDGFLPWNSGRWELEATPDGGRVSRTQANPDLALTAADMGAIYLGGVRFGELALAGRVEEQTPGAVARADALFCTALAPWCPGGF
jgi:predicted acetyltransferase